jgi:hypothetical protein
VPSRGRRSFRRVAIGSNRAYYLPQIKAVRCPAGIENFFTNTGPDPLSNAFLIVEGIVFC